MQKDQVIINMATMPQRVESLEAVVTLLLPQCDKMNIYLNNFEGKIPAFLQHEKIHLFESEKCYGDIGATGKFFPVINEKGYILTVDDDIFYPSDYVATCIDAVEKYERKAAITFHARIFPKNRPVKSYYKDADEFFIFHQEAIEDRQVNLAGTGVLAYHSDLVKITMEDFDYTNMCDIFFSIKCHNLDIPVYLIKHEKGWLKISDRYDMNYSISRSQVNHDELHTSIVNNINWKYYGRN